MHTLVSRTVPPQDDKTNAVLLYDETDVNVVSADKVKTVVRRAYKILRPGGRDYGTVVATFNSNQKITSLHGWCIPAQGLRGQGKGRRPGRASQGGGQRADQRRQSRGTADPRR
jgi:hypothetical protein